MSVIGMFLLLVLFLFILVSYMRRSSLETFLEEDKKEEIPLDEVGSISKVEKECTHAKKRM